MFPDFAERSVKISHRDKIFIIPKLSLLQYSQVLEIINQAEKQEQIYPDDATIYAKACDKLWIVLKKVLPRRILKDRNIFEYNDLVELCIYLAFGSYLDNKVDNSSHGKYYEIPSLPDYQFKAMRILGEIGAYTVEELLNEPASIFFALSEYLDRINADRAIEFIAEGVKAAFSDFDKLLHKRGDLTIPNPNYTQRDISLERQQELEEFLQDYKNSQK